MSNGRAGGVGKLRGRGRRGLRGPLNYRSPQYPLQDDETREDDCGNRDHSNGTIKITHDV